KNAALSTIATPTSSTAVSRKLRLVLLTVGKDRTPRLGQRRRAEHHQLDRHRRADRYARTVASHSPRLDTGQCRRLHRAVDHSLCLRMLAPDNLTIALPLRGD